MPAVIHAAHAIGRPGNNMRYAGQYLLLAPRTQERPGRAGPGDPADEPFTVAVGLPTLDPADSPTQIETGVLATSAMRSGHD